MAKKNVDQEQPTSQETPQAVEAPVAPKTGKPAPVVDPDAGKAFAHPEALKKAKERAPSRKFKQSWDLMINLKGLDLKKPENRFSLEFALPSGRGKQMKIGVIADSLAEDAQKAGADLVIRRDEIETLGKNKKRLKQVANETDWFFGEVTIMALVGKSLGTVLGPRGKVPKPIPPKADIAGMILRARNQIRLVLKESPVIHVCVGNEGMKDEDVLKNIEAVYQFVKDKLPKGLNNIRSMHVKLTMGRPVKMEIR